MNCRVVVLAWPCDLSDASRGGVRPIRASIRTALAMGGVALLAVGCTASEAELCEPSDDIAILVGDSRYVVPASELRLVTPEGGMTGLRKLRGLNRDSRGRVVSFCLERGRKHGNATNISLRYPSSREGKEVDNFISIATPDTFAAELRPKWPAFTSFDLDKITYGKVRRIRAEAAEVPINFRLKSGIVRSVTPTCTWIDQHLLRDEKGGWVVVCQPIIPSNDGNFLLISTGGVHEDRLEPMSKDIRDGLAKFEQIQKAGLTQ